jgi:LacI family transcriptional regulator
MKVAKSLTPSASTNAPARSPSVRYLVSILTERIRTGVYPRGQWFPSERALCAEFGVCRPTVRKAFDELESRNLLRRAARHRPIVWDGAETEETAARATGRRSIALWVSGHPGDHGPVAMTRTIYETLAGPDYTDFRLIVACAPAGSLAESIRGEQQALRQFAEDEDIVGALIWTLGGEESREALEAFRQRGKPLIFVDRQPPRGFEADFVGVHNEYAAAEAVHHLLNQGHRYIVHITNQDPASSVQERLEGYRRALREAGEPYRPELVLPGEFRDSDPDRYWRELVRTYRRLPGPPTAVFAVNDYAANRFIQALREGGLCIPEDVAVVGFDDSERWQSAPPFLSSVSQPFEEMGREAVHLLKERLEYGGSTYRHLLLPTTLKIRASSSWSV